MKKRHGSPLSSHSAANRTPFQPVTKQIKTIHGRRRTVEFWDPDIGECTAGHCTNRLSIELIEHLEKTLQVLANMLQDAASMFWPFWPAFNSLHVHCKHFHGCDTLVMISALQNTSTVFKLECLSLRDKRTKLRREPFDSMAFWKSLKVSNAVPLPQTLEAVWGCSCSWYPSNIFPFRSILIYFV